MTYPPGQPGDQWQSQGGGHPPPQQPQGPYPLAPYPPQPVPAPGIAVTAMVLCTLTSLCVVWSVIGLVVGNAFVVVYGLQFPGWATALNVIWAIGDLLLIVGTIFMWARNAAGRILAVAGLCLALAAVVSFELVSVSTPGEVVVRPWAWLIDIFAVLGLAFVLLPGTGAYLNAGRRPPYAPVSAPPYPPAGGPPIQ